MQVEEMGPASPPCLQTPGKFHELGVSYHRPEDPCSKLMWFLRNKGLIGNGMPNIPRKISCFLLEESESFLDGEQ